MQRLNLASRLFLAAVGAVFYFVAFVGFNQWYLAWVCLVPFFFALDGLSPKQGFWLGLFFGTVTLTGGFYWITYTIHVFAFMPWVVSALGCVLLSVAQGLEFAVFGFLYAWLRNRRGRGILLAATVSFVAAEFISPQLFPHYFAASQFRQIPLIQICDITGVLGLTALIVFVNACVYIMIRGVLAERRFLWRAALAAIAMPAIALAYGYLRIPAVESEMFAAPHLRFGIAQANLGIREKSRFPERAIRLNQEQTLQMKEMGADIVVWPETAVQAPVLSLDEETLPPDVFDDLGIPILTGALARESQTRRYPVFNAGILAGEDGRILGAYKKQKLLMLGEYIPLGEVFPVLYKWFPYIGRLTPGDSVKPLEFRGYALNVNICYEDILPRLINRMAKHAPNVFINLTNDNWFGKTYEPLQHLALAAFRSVEHRRWLVRSTNTGLSAFVDATGKIVDESPLMEPAMMIKDVPMLSSETIYARAGDWFGWLSLALVVIMAGLRRKDPKQEA